MKIGIACHLGDAGPYQKEVEAQVFGAWAAHEATSGAYYRVTFIRFGLAIPYDFSTEFGARNAAKAINALRPTWATVTDADIKAMGAEILAICRREKGERSTGPKGRGVPVTSLPSAVG